MAESFTAPGDDVERFDYGWSALHCLPVALVEPNSAGTGTVMRPDTVRRHAHEAEFTTVTVLSIEHESWRNYRLDPWPAEGHQLSGQRIRSCGWR